MFDFTIYQHARDFHQRYGACPKMTCNKNSVLLILAGVALVGLAGCSSQPYEPWQPGDSWWEKEQQGGKKAEMTKTAEDAAMANEMPATMPVMEERPDSGNVPVASPMGSQETSTTRTTGDVLLIDSIQSAPDMKTPRNGMTMDMVRRQFGTPISEGSSIGDPPITRWEYKDFSVYFEYNLVLHSVVHRPNRN